MQNGGMYLISPLATHWTFAGKVKSLLSFCYKTTETFRKYFKKIQTKICVTLQQMSYLTFGIILQQDA